MLDVVVDLYGADTSPNSIWATISTHITGGTTTRCMTADGNYAIINWPQVQAVTYASAGE